MDGFGAFSVLWRFCYEQKQGLCDALLVFQMKLPEQEEQRDLTWGAVHTCIFNQQSAAQVWICRHIFSSVKYFTSHQSLFFCIRNVLRVIEVHCFTLMLTDLDIWENHRFYIFPINSSPRFSVCAYILQEHASVAWSSAFQVSVSLFFCICSVSRCKKWPHSLGMFMNNLWLKT